jgi:hypothetical protein
MANVIYTDCHIQTLYGQCHYAACRNTECHYAECHGAFVMAATEKDNFYLGAMFA